MPSRRKSLMFASASFTSVCSFVIVCLVLATKNWISSHISYTDKNSTGTIIITYGLFQGFCSKTVLGGVGAPPSTFQVADVLIDTKLKSFNVVVILLLVLSLLSCFLSFGFTGYNAVSNPYQTFLGPIGVYTWNSISVTSSILTMILFAVNVEANKLSVELALGHCDFSRQNEKSLNTYGYSYWIMLVIIVLNAATITIIVFYQKARYSKKKERERPMESAPKDGILF